MLLNASMHASDDEKFLRRVCNERGLYDTPRLNNVIFLNDCGLLRVPCLVSYASLRSVHLNGNRLSHIPDLHKLAHLQSLYLQVRYDSIFYFLNIRTI